MEVGENTTKKNSLEIKNDKLERKVHKLTVDSVTQLLKKEGFIVKVEEKDEDINNILKNPHIVGIIDLNKFKEINDSYGHSKGDKYLNEIGNLLENVIWTDYQGIISRGKEGDEFNFIIPVMDELIKSKEDQYRENIQNISKKIGNSLITLGGQFEKEGIIKGNNPALCIGVILSSEGIANEDPSRTLEEYFKNIDKADKALYEAKKLRNTNDNNVNYVYYEDLKLANE